MKLCRFKKRNTVAICLGLITGNEQVRDLSAAGVSDLTALLEKETLLAELERLSQAALPEYPANELEWLPPIERQEIWAAGVTYLRSKKARKQESDYSAMAYEQVYHAPRPELFFKAVPEKVSGPGGPAGIRRDAHWSVPEAELVLVCNSHGKVAGLTLGNDMSSRDIEGHNLLYLPQAKTYKHSCAIGPCIALGFSEADVRTWDIHLDIERDQDFIFRGATKLSRLKRSFDELVEYLFRSQTFPHGAALLTGTGIIPPDGFALKPGDVVTIWLDEIGVLKNTVVVV